MGVVKIFDLSEDINGKLGIWEMNDSYAYLREKCNLSENDEKRIALIANEKRRCEFLSVRMLLQKMLSHREEITYNEAGKPELQNDYHITISHSSRLAAVLLSEQPTGIDIEQLNRNTEKVATRFLSEQENNHVQCTSNPPLTRLLYWCAKEALFKCSPLSGIDFRKHILINSFFPEPGRGKFFGQLTKDNQLVNFVFHYFIFNGHAVVYCTEKCL